jgi:hypothetical protein
MQFKITKTGNPVFYWSTVDESFEKISATEVVMKSRLLDNYVYKYISDLQVTFEDGTVYTYFTANLQIIQDITR